MSAAAETLAVRPVALSLRPRPSIPGGPARPQAPDAPQLEARLRSSPSLCRAAQATVAAAAACACALRRSRRSVRVARRADDGQVPEAPHEEPLAAPQLGSWLADAKLHGSLAADIAERFGSVPQQAASVIEDTVGRIELGARRCIAPCACAHPFGSTVNGFGEASSDLDILVAVDDEELCYFMSYVHWDMKEKRYDEVSRLQEDGRWSGGKPPSWPHVVAVDSKVAMACAVTQMADYLPELGFQVEKTLPRARRPLVTLSDRTPGGLEECDVSINNRLPLCNTELLRSYSQLDPRIRPLVLLVKTWAKGHKICGANEGNLSSYAWTVMVIYVLQLTGVVPSLQALAKEERTVVDQDYWGYEREFDTSFLTAEEYLKEREKEGLGQAEPQLSLGDLLYGFFRFFGEEYVWGDEVVSMRSPDRRRADAWWRLYGKPHPEPGIHVEDPIELRDLNIVLRRDRLAALKLELANAASLLGRGGSLEELFGSEPLAVPPGLMPVRRSSRRYRRFQNR